MDYVENTSLMKKNTPHAYENKKTKSLYCWSRRRSRLHH